MFWRGAVTFGRSGVIAGGTGNTGPYERPVDLRRREPLAAAARRDGDAGRRFVVLRVRAERHDRGRAPARRVLRRHALPLALRAAGRWSPAGAPGRRGR